MTEFLKTETTLRNYENVVHDYLKAHPGWWCGGYRLVKIHKLKNDNKPYPSKWNHDPRNIIEVTFHDGDIGVGLRYENQSTTVDLGYGYNPDTKSTVM